MEYHIVEKKLTGILILSKKQFTTNYRIFQLEPLMTGRFKGGKKLSLKGPLLTETRDAMLQWHTYLHPFQHSSEKFTCPEHSIFEINSILVYTI